jgi:hypothetical protein
METRGATRFNVLGAGTIEFDGGEVNCVVRDMSITGAALEVLSSRSIPQHFTLALRADRQRIPATLCGAKKSGWVRRLIGSPKLRVVQSSVGKYRFVNSI